MNKDNLEVKVPEWIRIIENKLKTKKIKKVTKLNRV